MPTIFDRDTRPILAAENFLSLIGREICPEHLDAVWDAVFEYMEEQLHEGHGVKIPGLANLSYKNIQKHLSNKYIVVERHAYLLISEQLVNMYALKSKRPPYSLVTSTELNLEWIAYRTSLNRSDVQICVEEVVHAFRNALVSDDHVEFHFDKIGKIVMRCNVVTFELEDEFMCRHRFGFRSYYDKKCTPPM